MLEGVDNKIKQISIHQDLFNNSSNQQLINSSLQLNVLKNNANQKSKRESMKDNNAYLMTNLPLRPHQKKTSNEQLSNDNFKRDTSITRLFGKPKKKQVAWKRRLGKIINSLPVIIYLSIITLFALFASDIQAACLPILVDTPFNIIQCFILVSFVIELVLNCLANDDYPLSFFFWLDLIAAISMVQDIDFIINDIIGYQPITVYSVKGRKKNVDQAAKLIAEVSSASRTIRVLRIIRLLKLIRMVKLYKNVYMAKEDADKKKTEALIKSSEQIKSNSSEVSTSASKSNCKDNRNHPKGLKLLPISEHREEEEVSHTYQPSSPYRSKLRYIPIHNFPKPKTQSKQVDELDNDELLKESKISKMFTNSINKKIVVLIVSLLMVLSVLSNDFYTDDSEIVYSFLSTLLANYYNIIFQFSNYTVPNFINTTNLFDSAFPPINITYNNNPVFVNELYSNVDFRYKEVRVIFSDDASIQIVYSIRTETSMIGIMNICQTLFVCLCMTITSITFEFEATKYVLNPLEVIIEIVENVAKDPVNAKNVEELQSGIKASVEKLSKEVSINFEIQVIKGAIIKIAALLAIGFGDAGGEIIKENLSTNHELNPLLKGKKKTAIFGFCDIRDFEKINIALEERSILFVNQIAEIVHSSVDRFKGATNKNIGDSFFNVWKFYTDPRIQKSSNCLPIRDNLLESDPTNPKINVIADCSVLAFLRIILKINKNIQILAYRNHPKILKLIPEYKVTMGFGLHLGYAIEGAIGSTYKIDASYLSPNVNIAARLESATRQFRVPLLLSGTVYQKLSDELKSICRYIDCVIVKGSLQIIDLYTIDMNFAITPEREKTICILPNKMLRRIYEEKKTFLQSLINQYGSVTQLILEKQSYIELIKTRDCEFTKDWDQAIFAYKCGDWKEAESFLIKCGLAYPDDGPTRTLYSYIKNRNCIAPEGWNGVRELTAK